MSIHDYSQLSQNLPNFSTHQVLGLLVSQIREKPAVIFGNPEYTPGGKALPFYASIRVRVYRQKIIRPGANKQNIGLLGYARNIKNKAGGREQERCSFRIYWDKPSVYEEFRKVE